MSGTVVLTAAAGQPVLPDDNQALWMLAPFTYLLIVAILGALIYGVFRLGINHARSSR